MDAALTALGVGVPMGIALIYAIRAVVSSVPAANERARVADERGNAQELRAERAEYQFAQAKQALIDADETIQRMSKELDDALDATQPGDGLAAGDIRSRVRRIAEAARAKSRGALPAVASEAVPDAPTAPGAAATALPPLEDPRLQ